MAGPLSSAAAAGDDSLSNSRDLHVKAFLKSMCPQQSWQPCFTFGHGNATTSFPVVEANAEYYIKNKQNKTKQKGL